MSYTPTVWKGGDVVSSVKLNKLENGVAAAASGADALTSEVLEIELNSSEEKKGTQIQLEDEAVVDVVLNGPATALYDGTAVIDGVNIKVTGLNGQLTLTNAFIIAAGQVNKANGADNFIADRLPIAAEAGIERLTGRSNSSMIELALLKTTCDYTVDAANAWLQSHPIRIWFPTPNYATATGFYYNLKCSKTGSWFCIGNTQPVSQLSSGDTLSFRTGKYSIGGSSGKVSMSGSLTSVPSGSLLSSAGEIAVKTLISLEGELGKKVDLAGWNEVTPKNTTFFDNINYFDPSEASFVTGVFVDFNGKIVSSSGVNSLIMAVKPSTQYILLIPNNNRGIIVGGTSTEFVIGETYQVLYSAGAAVTGYVFTTGATDTGICVYFYSGTYDYETNKNYIRLFEGSILPQDDSPVIKRENLPQDIVSASSPLTAKNVLIFGDSITDTCNFTINSADQTTAVTWRNPSNSYVDAGGTTIQYNMWPKILRDMGLCSEIRNYARSGASYKTASRQAGEERQNLEYQITVALNDLDNPNGAFDVDDFVPDIVIFALGTNDGAPNDTYADAMAKTVLAADGDSIDAAATLANLDNTKFCEAARSAFLRTRIAFPYAQFFCVLPIQRANSELNGENLNTYLRQMARRYGCVIIDGYAESGIIRDTNVWNALGSTLKDGLHPNDKGQNMMFRMIYSALKANYFETNAMNP